MIVDDLVGVQGSIFSSIYPVLELGGVRILGADIREEENETIFLPKLHRSQKGVQFCGN